MRVASRGGSIRSWLVSLGICGLLGSAACSSGAGGGADAGAGGKAPGSGGADGAAGASGIGGALGSGGSGTAGTTGSGGSTGGGTGGRGTGGATAGSGGTTGGGAGASGAGGAAACAGRAISLAANGTGTDSDVAYSRVVIDLMTDLPIGNAGRTIEFWAFIKTTDWMGERNELFEYGGAASAAGFGLDFGTNPVLNMAGNHATLNPFTNGGFNDDSTNNLGITSTSNQWVHIAMTWDGVALRTYVNGALGITTNASGGITALATAQSPLSMGCNFQNMNCFNGYFDELRFWNVARTATQLHDNYNRPLAGDETGLIGYWKFDDVPGSATAADSVGGGRTLHPGMLTSAGSAAQRPVFVTPTPPVPLVCP